MARNPRFVGDKESEDEGDNRNQREGSAERNEDDENEDGDNPVRQVNQGRLVFVPVFRGSCQV